MILTTEIVMLTTSCDYYLEQKALVIDSKTLEPIINAKVDIYNFSEITDSIGFCEFGEISGDLSTRMIMVEKAGYESFKIQIERKDGYWLYKQEIDSMYSLVNSFSARKDTLVVYLEQLVSY